MRGFLVSNNHSFSVRQLPNYWKLSWLMIEIGPLYREVLPEFCTPIVILGCLDRWLSQWCMYQSLIMIMIIMAWMVMTISAKHNGFRSAPINPRNGSDRLLLRQHLMTMVMASIMLTLIQTIIMLVMMVAMRTMMLMMMWWCDDVMMMSSSKG